MNETSDQILERPLRESWFSRFQVVALAALTMISIIGKFYLPRLIPHTEWLELPLLLTIYFGLMRRSPIASLLFGAFVGLSEDSLSPANLPIGMYGITKTLVGYFAASVSVRFNVENSVIRLILCFFFFFFTPSSTGSCAGRCWGKLSRLTRRNICPRSVKCCRGITFVRNPR